MFSCWMGFLGDCMWHLLLVSWGVGILGLIVCLFRVGLGGGSVPVPGRIPYPQLKL